MTVHRSAPDLTSLPQVPLESQWSHLFVGFDATPGTVRLRANTSWRPRTATDQAKRVTGRRGGEAGPASREQPELVTRHAGPRRGFAERSAAPCERSAGYRESEAAGRDTPAD